MPDNICLIHNDTSRVITMTCRLGELSEEIVEMQKKGMFTIDPRAYMKMKLVPGTNRVPTGTLAAIKDQHKRIFQEYVDNGDLLITDAAIKAAERRDEPANNEMDQKIADARKEGEEVGSKASKIIADNLASAETALADKDSQISELKNALEVANANADSDTGE